MSSDPAFIGRRRLLAGATATAAAAVALTRDASAEAGEAHGLLLNVKDFGALGDGSRDDGPAFQKALAALAGAGGGTLLVPDGRFVIASPVVYNFLNDASSVVLRGRGSSSQIIVATGAGAKALAFQSLHHLVVDSLTFVGREGVRTDARAALAVEYCIKAVVRNTDFYGVSSMESGGSVLLSRHSALSIEHCAFRGCTGNSGVDAPVVDNVNWRALVVSDTDFIDYGFLNGKFLSKTGVASPSAWIQLGDALPLTDALAQGEVRLERVRLDEAAFRAIAVVPNDARSARIADVTMSGLRVNGGNFDDVRGVHIQHAENVTISNSFFGYASRPGDAIHLVNVDRARIDQCRCIGSMDAIYADGATKSVTVVDTIYGRLRSRARTTSVIADGVTSTALKVAQPVERATVVRWSPGYGRTVVPASDATATSAIAGIALESAAPGDPGGGVARVVSLRGSIVTVTSDGRTPIAVNDALACSARVPGRVTRVEAGEHLARAITSAPAEAGATLQVELVPGVVGETRALALALRSPWRQVAGGAPATYRRDRSGSVSLSGVVSGGSTGTIATLPPGFRPSHRLEFLTASSGKPARIVVPPDGTVTLSSGGSSRSTSLDGIRFYP